MYQNNVYFMPISDNSFFIFSIFPSQMFSKGSRVGFTCRLIITDMAALIEAVDRPENKQLTILVT